MSGSLPLKSDAPAAGGPSQRFGGAGPEVAGVGPTSGARAFDRALSGDRAAFGVFVRETQDRLFNVLFRILGNRDEAREVAQDTYLKAMTSLHTFRGHSSPYTWLYRIGVNLAVSRLRRVRRQRTSHGRPTLPRSSPPDTPPEAALRAERSTQVLAALARLDSEYRAVLVLREVDGLDYGEMAEILQVPVGTVKSRLFRARLALRHELQRYMGTVKASRGTNLPPPAGLPSAPQARTGGLP